MRLSQCNHDALSRSGSSAGGFFAEVSQLDAANIAEFLRREERFQQT